MGMMVLLSTAVVLLLRFVVTMELGVPSLA